MAQHTTQVRENWKALRISTEHRGTKLDNEVAVFPLFSEIKSDVAANDVQYKAVRSPPSHAQK